MKKRTKWVHFAAVCVLLFTVAALLMSPGVEASASTSASNEKKIFQYLTDTMGLNSAAASGLLANIYRESNFNPTAGGSSSYGICQWYGSRFTALKNYCSGKGLDYTTLEAQLSFLNYDLSGFTYKYIYDFLSGVPDDAMGAYWAGYYWCFNFERPSRYMIASVSRGELARDTYWPKYGDTSGEGAAAPTISGAAVPGTLTEGDSFSVSGKISSATTLTSVTVGVYDLAGNRIMTATANPGSKSYDVSNLKSKLKWSSLDAYVYTYRIEAANKGGTSVLVESVFSVFSKTGIYKEGNIRIACLNNTSLSLAATSDSSSLKLLNSTTSSRCEFQAVKVGEGYYAIRSLLHDQYLTVTSGGEVSFAGWSGEDTQRWQILKAATGIYCLIPKSNSGAGLTVNGDRAENDTLKVADLTLGENQVWKLYSVDNSAAVEAPVALEDVSLKVSKTSYTKTYSTTAFSLKVTSDGTLTYKSSDTSVVTVTKAGKVKMKGYGTATITVTASKSGCNSQTAKITVKVKPRQMTLKSVTSPSKKTLKATWTKDSKATGYVIQISTKKSFAAKYRQKAAVKKSKSSYKFTKLTSGKTYYVRIRAYKTVDGTKIYGKWSDVKKIKVK